MGGHAAKAWCRCLLRARWAEVCNKPSLLAADLPACSTYNQFQPKQTKLHHTMEQYMLNLVHLAKILGWNSNQSNMLPWTKNLRQNPNVKKAYTSMNVFKKKDDSCVTCHIIVTVRYLQLVSYVSTHKKCFRSSWSQKLRKKQSKW